MEEMEKIESFESVGSVQNEENTEKKKVLLIKLSSLGDVVFNIPLANALKDAGYEVTWLVSERGIQVVEGNPCVDKVILAPVQKWRKRGLKLENFKEYFTLIKQLREEKFDIAIDSQMILKSMIWTMFCGAKRRIIAKDAREGAILGGNEWIEKIFDTFVSRIKQQEVNRKEYQSVNIHDQDTFRRGLNEGSHQAKIETARILLTLGDTIEKISKATGLSQETVIELAKNRP